MDCIHCIDTQNFCMNCGEEILDTQPIIQYDRYKSSSEQKRKSYFTKIIECYTGHQIFKDDKIIDKIRLFLGTYYKNATITQRHIHIALKHLKLKRYYNNEYLFYCMITNTPYRSLTIEMKGTLERMYNDFTKLYIRYYPLHNFISIKYILHRFLNHLQYPNENIFYKSLETYKKQKIMFDRCFLEMNEDYGIFTYNR